MGLDISVNVTVEEVRNNLCELEFPLQQNEAARILDKMNAEDTISVRPGSYSGLHTVRREYGKLKGWPLDSTGVYVEQTETTLQSHLLNHSDCDGWYLPEAFDEPLWSGYVSIGSSVRLLEEITELLAVKDQWPESFQFRWDAVFIAAVASVVTRTPIEFH